MKILNRSFPLAFMCLLVSSFAFSQVKIIPKAGASLSTVSFRHNQSSDRETFDYGSKAGFVAGVGVEVAIIPGRFSLQSDLLFAQKGYTSRYSSADNVYASHYTTTLNYIDMPLMAKFYFGRFYATAGSYASIGAGGSYSGTDSYMGHVAQNEGNVRYGRKPNSYNGSADYANLLDAGLLAGAGVKLGAIVIDLRYSQGLSTVYGKQNPDAPALNSSFQLTVGMPCSIKH